MAARGKGWRGRRMRQAFGQCCHGRRGSQGTGPDASSLGPEERAEAIAPAVSKTNMCHFFSRLTNTPGIAPCQVVTYRIKLIQFIPYAAPAGFPPSRNPRRYVMTMLAWNDRLSVNIAAIDKQHRKLVDMVNELHDAMKTGKTAPVLLRIVNEMKEYAATHFSLEERYMKNNNYPEYQAHKMEHDEFVAKVIRVENDCKTGKCAMSMDILSFLSRWLVNHIKGTDKKYGPFLNNCGIH
jgi:hemerythrin